MLYGIGMVGVSPNKRMLSDWFSAALQTSRKCGRYVSKTVGAENLEG